MARAGEDHYYHHHHCQEEVIHYDHHSPILLVLSPSLLPPPASCHDGVSMVVKCLLPLLLLQHQSPYGTLFSFID